MDCTILIPWNVGIRHRLTPKGPGAAAANPGPPAFRDLT